MNDSNIAFGAPRIEPRWTSSATDGIGTARFWISLVLTLPILALSPMLQKLVGLREAIHFPGDIYVLFAFSSAVFWYGGSPLKGLFDELKTACRAR